MSSRDMTEVQGSMESTSSQGPAMTAATIPAFTLDGLDESWPAVRYGQRWLGWATPVVDRPTLEAVLTAVVNSMGDAGVRWEWEGAAAVIVYREQHDGHPGVEDMIPPTVDDEDLYDLGLLEWRFIETDFWSQHEDLAQLSEITEHATGLRAIDLDPTDGSRSVFHPSEILACARCGVVRATVLIGVGWDETHERLCADCTRQSLYG